MQGFQLHHVDVEDTERTNMLAHFEECNHIISEALSKREGVLIHCHAGVSRSATLCAAYLMSHYQTTSEGE